MNSTDNSHKEIIIIGYSGHSYVVADAILSSNDIIKGYCDEGATSNPLGIESMGKENNKLLSNQYWIVAIGDNRIRRQIVESFSGVGTLEKVIHCSSTIGVKVKIGKGSFLAAQTVINPLVEIGLGCIINTGAIVEHECKIGDYTHIAPGVVLAGNVKVGENSFIGANAVVKQGVVIGDNVIVGAGSVVLKDVPNGMTVAGNPARALR